MSSPEEAAQDVLKDFWISLGRPERDQLFPLSPYDVASFLGCQIALKDRIRVGSEEMAGEYSPGIPTLTVATKFPISVQRFTLAHEIGHRVLHPDEVAHREPPYFTDEHRTGRPWLAPRERQANRFAAELLMPERAFRQAFMDRFGRELSLRSMSEGLSFTLLRDTPVPRLRNAQVDALTVEQLALVLVSAKRGRDGPFKSLANDFWVSPIAASIRAEQLGLVRA